MKKTFAIMAIGLLAACNSNEPAKTDTTTSDSTKSSTSAMSTMPAIQSPYQIGYSSSFVMDEPKNAETVLALWKDWDNGDLSKSKDRFADSISLHMADGSSMTGKKDSIIASAQKFRASLGTAVSRVDAIMAVKSTDKNEHWALIWGMEKDTDAKGKVDSFYLQETWRFNNDGKADMLFQFRAAGAPPKQAK